MKFRETVPYKSTSGDTITYTYQPQSEKPTSGVKPTETTTPPFEISPANLKKIGKCRERLINLLVGGLDKGDENYLKLTQEIREQGKDKPLGYFKSKWNELIKDVNVLDAKVNIKLPQAFIAELDQWEDWEKEPSSFYIPKSRIILEWYLLNRLAWPEYEKIVNLKKEDGSPRIKLNLKYQLADLKILLPKPKKPKPRPENAPLERQIQDFQESFTIRLRSYTIAETPRFIPEEEINRVGKADFGSDGDWHTWIANSGDFRNHMGVFTDLQRRIELVQLLAVQIIVKELIERRDKTRLSGLIEDFKWEQEQVIYETEPIKTQIYNILNNLTPPEPKKVEKLMDYDQLFTAHEKLHSTELLITGLSAEQWDRIDDDSELKQGTLELKNFPYLKKLTIKINRPYLDAKIIKTINIRNTAEKLEEIKADRNDNLEQLIIGTKPNLKKLDVRWTSLKKLDLLKTQITLKDYDTLNFPIRMSGGAEMLPREKDESDYDFASKIYRQGTIIYPFSQFSGDSSLITLPISNIKFSEPWLRYDKDWSGIELEFKKHWEHIQEWYDLKLNWGIAKEWKDAGISPIYDKAKYVCWLIFERKLKSETVLNDYDIFALEAEFKSSQAKTLTELLRVYYPQEKTETIELDQYFQNVADRYAGEQLDFSFYGKYLKKINVSSGKIRAIKVDRNRNLESLSIADNELTEIDLSKNLKMIRINADDNNLKGKLDVKYLSKLAYLKCKNNFLTSLEAHINFKPKIVRTSFGNYFFGEREKKDNWLNNVSRALFMPQFSKEPKGFKNSTNKLELTDFIWNKEPPKTPKKDDSSDDEYYSAEE